MFEVWNYRHVFQGGLSDITLPGGLTLPSGKDWAGLGPGSIPYIGNQQGVNTEGAIANQPSYHGPADYASKVRWYLSGKGGGYPTPPAGWFGFMPGPSGPSARGACGPGTNDPNCTGGAQQCPPGLVWLNGSCQGGPELGPPILPLPRVTPGGGTTVETPPLTAPGGGSIATSPVSHVRAHRQRRPRVRQPYTDPNDICPIRGYVSRPIPGVDEYQNFRCTPGQPIVIDPGIAAAGRADALARQRVQGGPGGPSLWTGQAGGWGWGTPYYNPRVRWEESQPSVAGLGGLLDESIDIAGIQVPSIALIAGAVALGWWMMKGKGKR